MATADQVYRQQFRDLCAAGDLDAVQAFVKDSRHHVLREAFRGAFDNGHAHIARWIMAEFGGVDLETETRDAIPWACGMDRPDMAQWLVDEGVPMDPRVVQQALFGACANGCLSAVQWLARQTSLADVPDLPMYMAVACRSGCLELVKWLRPAVHLGDADQEHCFSIASTCARVDVAKWLVEPVECVECVEWRDA